MLTNFYPSGFIWAVSTQFRLIWAHLDLFGPIWSRLDPFGPIWTHLDSFGPIWTYLDPFGPVGPFGPIWNWWSSFGRPGPSDAKTMMMICCSGRGMSTTLGSAERRQLPRPSHKSSSLSSPYWWRRKIAQFSAQIIIYCAIYCANNPPTQHSTHRYFSNQTDCFSHWQRDPLHWI